jgi:hypothetical protein
VGLEGCLYSKTVQQKNGSEHATSEPLFISTARFDLLAPDPLTLLLIGRRRHLDAASSFLRSPLPYTLIMAVELDQVPFGIEKVKHPTVQPA